MSCCNNNNNNARRRTRRKSCPAGVRFEANDIKNVDIITDRRNKPPSNWYSNLAKEANATSAGRRGRGCSLTQDDMRSANGEPNRRHLLNYTAGGTHNLFGCKLEGIVRSGGSHSLIHLTHHQHKEPNKSDIEERVTGSTRKSSPNISISCPTLEGSIAALDKSNLGLGSCDNDFVRESSIWNCDETAVVVKNVNTNASLFGALNEEKRWKSWFGFGSKVNKEEENVGSCVLAEGFVGELDSLKVIDLDDTTVQLLYVEQARRPGESAVDAEVGRLKCHVYNTELLVESLASQVEATRTELTMSKKKQENELSDILSLNEEMQSIWSEKESEVREILERFATYRDAVEADSKEKDELYSEELSKREMIISEAAFAKNNLAKRLSERDKALEVIIKDLKALETARLQEFFEIDKLVGDLAEKYTEDETAAKEACQTISERLQSVIIEFKGQDFTKYTSHFDVNEQGRLHTGSVDIGSETDRDLNEFTSSEHSSYIDKERLHEEDLLKLMKRTEERGVECEKNASDEEDGLVEAFIERKAVVRLLEEQWTRYQLQCKEKEDEMQHWKRKHKQDTKNLQELLEDQERSELKTREVTSELQAEVDKLRRRKNALESDIEMAKEQGEDEVCVLREDFEKHLASQLRRQSKSFLSVEEASRSQLAELEQSNDELRRSNDDLRREIDDHCAEIKCWVTEILLLTEEQYSEEFHTITDVLRKLQAIIVDNKRTMAELRDELAECANNRSSDPCSPTDELLSRSWGGHSWSSVDSQKELCRNCRQTKWRRVLMGSFDLVEAGLDVKQDEVETFVAKINMDDPKYRKRKSLKDSLELAEARTELIESLGEDHWNALGTLSEGSLEEKADSPGSLPEGFQGFSSEGTKEADRRSPSADVELVVLTLESRNKPGCQLQAARADSGIVDHDSGTMSPEEVDGLGRRSSHLDPNGAEAHEGTRDTQDEWEVGGKKWKEMGDAGGEEMNATKERKRGSEGDVIMKWATEQGLIICVEDCDATIDEEKRDDHGDDDDVNNHIHDHFVDGHLDDGHLDDGHHHLDDGNLDDDNYDRVNSNNGDIDDNVHDHVVNNNGNDHGNDYTRNGDDDEHGDGDGDHDDDNEDLVRVVNLYRSLVFNNCNPSSTSRASSPSSDNSSSAMNYRSQKTDAISLSDDITGDEKLAGRGAMDNLDNQDIEEQRGSRNENAFSDPKIVHDKDYGSVPGDHIDGEARDNLKEMDSELPSNRELLQWSNSNGLLGEGSNSKPLEIKEDGITAPELRSSGTYKAVIKYTNSEKSLEILGNAQDLVGPAQSCSHCSRILAESGARYEKAIAKLLELQSLQQEKGNELEIFRELDATKVEVERYRRQHEEFQRERDEYLDRIHECSEKVKKKSAELRRLKLTNNVMETEVEWLRQALGITRDYSALRN